MSIPTVSALTPTVIPAIPEKVFDRYHTARILVDATNPNDPIVAIVHLRKGRLTDDNLWELATLADPDPDKNQLVLRTDDLMAVATERAMAGKPLIAQAVTVLLEAVAEWATEALTPPEPPPEEPT